MFKKYLIFLHFWQIFSNISSPSLDIRASSLVEPGKKAFEPRASSHEPRLVAPLVQILNLQTSRWVGLQEITDTMVEAVGDTKWVRKRMIKGFIICHGMAISYLYFQVLRPWWPIWEVKWREGTSWKTMRRGTRSSERRSVTLLKITI